MTSRRDPSNELYDRACDLLEAARELHLAATRDGNVDAIAATLGCAEAALGELAETYRVLHEVSDVMLRRPAVVGGGQHLEVEARFAGAVAALDHARTASDAARAAVGHSLAEVAGSRARGFQP